MSGFDWFLVGWFLLGCFITIAQIGKPKEPTTPRVAAITVAIHLGLVVALLISRGAFA